MNKLLAILIASSMIFTSTLTQAWEPDTSDKLELSVAQAIIKAKQKDPAFSTVVGLLLYKAGDHTPYEINFQQELLHSKANYEEDIRDIKITNTMSEVEDKKTSSKESKKEVIKKVDPSEEGAIIFDDLPDIGKENSNPFKKLTNWAKQLF